MSTRSAVLAVFACSTLAAGCSSSSGSTHLPREGGAVGATSADAGVHEDSGGAGECDMPLPPRALSTARYASSLETYFPTADFRTADPAAAGMDADKLAAAVALMSTHNHTQGVLVLRHGYIVTEWYASGFTKEMRHESYSMAKSIVSAAVGIAIDQKKISGIDERVCKYYSEWNCNDSSDPRSRITVEHTMNIETGLDWNEDWRASATGPNDAILSGSNMLDYVLAKKAVSEPGTKQRYSTGDPALLSGVLQGATGKTVFEYAKSVLLDAIGMGGIGWNADSKGRTTTYAGVQATLREFAKFGFLYQNHGKWDGTQIVPGDWVDFTTRGKDPCRDEYRYLWHINPPIRLGEQDPSCPFLACPPTSYADLPADAFFAEGISGQFVFVVPSYDLVVAKLAQDDFGSDYWDDFGRDMLVKVLDSVVTMN